MISDDEIAQLPEDPELAFVELERLVRERVEDQEAQEQRLNSDEGIFYSADPYRRDYINKVLAAARHYGITDLEGWKVPSIRDDIAHIFVDFTLAVDHVTMQVRLRHGPRNRQNSVGLDATARAKIQHYIAQIREAIDKANLPESKRESLYKKLNNFSLEVDKNRTSLQSGMAFYIAVCDGIGQGFEKLEPARKWIDSISTLLGRAKDIEDNMRPALPRQAERKQLEGPHGRLSPSASNSKDLEGEVPF